MRAVPGEERTSLPPRLRVVGPPVPSPEDRSASSRGVSGAAPSPEIEGTCPLLVPSSGWAEHGTPHPRRGVGPKPQEPRPGPTPPRQEAEPAQPRPALRSTACSRGRPQPAPPPRRPPALGSPPVAPTLRPGPTRPRRVLAAGRGEPGSPPSLPLPRATARAGRTHRGPEPGASWALHSGARGSRCSSARTRLGVRRRRRRRRSSGRGGASRDRGASFPARSPLTAEPEPRARERPPTRPPPTTGPGGGRSLPHFTGRETEHWSGQGLAQGYPAGLLQPGEDSAAQPTATLQGEKGNFWTSGVDGEVGGTPWACLGSSRLQGRGGRKRYTGLAGRGCCAAAACPPLWAAGRATGSRPAAALPSVSGSPTSSRDWNREGGEPQTTL